MSASRHNSSSPPKRRDSRTQSRASAAGDACFDSIKFLAIDEQSENAFLKLLRAFSAELITLFQRCSHI
jgi:hypothetical protein